MARNIGIYEIAAFAYGLCVLIYFTYQSWIDAAWNLVNGYPHKDITPSDEEVREGMQSCYRTNTHGVD
jgi:hypothetical protein